MSKLFDTLEKINKNEVADDIAQPAPKKVSPQRNQWPLYLLGIVIVASCLFWGIFSFNFQQIENIATNFQKQNNPLPQPKTQSQAQVIKQRPPLKKNKLEKMTDLNNQGVALVTRNQHWQGIYYFSEAKKLQPGRVEPLINLAVTLTELHLYGPARRYFKEAVKLDPNNPLLCKNINIATDLGIMKD